MLNFIDRELPLRKGDTVYLLQQIDKNWFKGERHGTVGIFPVSNVEVSEYMQLVLHLIVNLPAENAVYFIHEYLKFAICYFVTRLICIKLVRGRTTVRENRFYQKSVETLDSDCIGNKFRILVPKWSFC